MTKKMRIVWSGMAAPQVSGGDVYIKKIIERIDTTAVDVDLITAGPASGIVNDQQLQLMSVRQLDTTTAGNLASLFMLYGARIYKGIFAVLKQQHVQFNTVLASSPFMYDILPAILTKSDTRAVILFHLIPERKGRGLATKIRFAAARAEQRMSLWLIRKNFDIVFVGNELLKQEIETRLPGKKVFVAHAGIDTVIIDRYANHEEKPKDTALFIGRLTQQKGVDDLMAVMESVHQTLPALRLKLVGDGPDRSRIEKLIQQKNLTNIEVLGFVSEEVKYTLLNQAKLFLFPSYEEGWGIALAEALYANCIGVCYELPHYKSLFGDYPAYAPLGSKDELTRQLIAAYGRDVLPSQKDAIRQYDDETVVRGVMCHLGLY